MCLQRWMLLLPPLRCTDPPFLHLGRVMVMGNAVPLPELDQDCGTTSHSGSDRESLPSPPYDSTMIHTPPPRFGHTFTTERRNRQVPQVCE